RGYNPHHRKVPSYYPITAYEAQSGQVLRVQTRPGTVHDGKAALPFLRALLHQVRATLGRGFHDGAQRHVASCEHTSAVLGMTEAVVREHVDDRRRSVAAAPGVSILPCVLGRTVVRRHRMPCGTRDRPIYGRASGAEPSRDAI
ncbi:MAG: transposase, partial [Egibacteraceae bacterium]